MRKTICKKQADAEIIFNMEEGYKPKYETLRNNVDWIETVVNEAKDRHLSDDVYAKLIDKLLVTSQHERNAARKKKQKSMVDFSPDINLWLIEAL